MFSVQITLCTVQCILLGTHGTLNSVQSILFSVQIPLFSVQIPLFSVQSTVYDVESHQLIEVCVPLMGLWEFLRTQRSGKVRRLFVGFLSVHLIYYLGDSSTLQPIKSVSHYAMLFTCTLSSSILNLRYSYYT